MGVKQYAMAEKKGLEQITNEDLKDESVASPTEQSEKYREENHK